MLLRPVHRATERPGTATKRPDLDHNLIEQNLEEEHDNAETCFGQPQTTLHWTSPPRLTQDTSPGPLPPFGDPEVMPRVTSAALSPDPSLPPKPLLTGRVEGIKPDGRAWIPAPPGGLLTDLAGALPHEQVQYQLEGHGAHRAFATLVTVLEPHPARVAPVCPLASACGSCDFMHIHLKTQEKWKEDAVRFALAPHLTPVTEWQPIISSPQALGYRRRTRFVVQGQAGQLELGAWRTGSHTLIDVEACPVTDPILLYARTHLREALNQTGLTPYDERTGRGELRAVVLQTDLESFSVLGLIVVTEPSPPLQGFSSWHAWADACLENCSLPGIHGLALNVHPSSGNALVGADTIPLAGHQSLSLSLRNVNLEVPIGAFSQVNLEVASLIYQQAARWACAQTPQRPTSPLPLTTGGMVDLYCGVGGLGLSVLTHARSRGLETPFLIGLETHNGAISAARNNAVRLGFSNTHFEAGPVKLHLMSLLNGRPLGVALVNPPRAGLGKGAVQALLSAAPQRILYVSCSPDSLARDLALLLPTGYHLVTVQAFDMFPQTHHVETLVWLERNAG